MANKPSKKTKRCKTCSELIVSSRTYCKDCWQNKSLSNKSLGELLELNSDSSTESVSIVRKKIRSQANKIYSKLKNSSCIKCGYTLFVELAHIDAIANFGLESLVSEVNDVSNIIPLCPNCHWEFDHGYFTIKDLGI